MKNLLILFFSVAFTQIHAQQLNLQKGMKIIAHSVINADTDMGMGMVMQNNSETDVLLEIISVKENVYEISNQYTAIKLNMDMMGQTTNYDSKNEKDTSSEMGKMIGPIMQKKTSYYVNRITGKVTPVDAADASAETNFGGIMPVSNDQSASVSDAFLILTPAHLKDKMWTESDSTAATKKNIQYTIQSIQSDEAKLIFESTVMSKNTMEQSGMEINMYMNTKSTGEMIVDTKTMLVKKKTIISDITGTMDAAGQTMNLSGKQTTTITYSIQ